MGKEKGQIPERPAIPPPYKYDLQSPPAAPATKIERRAAHDFAQKMPDLVWPVRPSTGFSIIQRDAHLLIDEYFRIQGEALRLRNLPAGESFEAAAKSVELQVRMFEACVLKMSDAVAEGTLKGNVYYTKR